MNLKPSSWVLPAVLITAIAVSTAGAQTATSRAPGRPSAVVLPVQGPIEWKLSVESFEKTLKMACAQKPQVLVLEISSPGGVVDYTWSMIRLFKSMREPQTVAWINGEHNGAFSSGAIFALACDKIYMAPGQAIGAAVPYELDDNGIPRDVALKWQSAWHAQVRALCEMKNRPWPVVYALLSAGAGLYKVKTETGYDYVNYEGIRPKLKPELARQMDATVRALLEESENNRAGARRTTVQRVTTDGMPANIEVICNLGEVLTLTAKEAVQCGLCDGVADSVEELLQKINVSADSPPRTLPDPFKQSNTQMDGVVKTFLGSIAALGGSVQSDGTGHRRLSFSGAGLRDTRALAECRKIRTLMDRYPDLIGSQETRAQINAAITHIQARLEDQRR